jgi:hypothetical protein
VGGSGAQLCETRAAPSFADIQPEFHVANSPLRVQDHARGVQVIESQGVVGLAA